MAEGTNILRQYIDRAGLEKVWGKIKENFSTKTEVAEIQSKHSKDISNVTSRISDLEDAMGNSAVSSVDKITITDNGQGKISTAISIELDEKNQKINLVATGPQATSENRIIGGVSYASFLKDGILKNVRLVEVDDSTDREAGTYLVFTFNTEAEADDIYVNVSNLVNMYEGSDYISINSDVIELNYEALENTLTNTFVKKEDHETTVKNITDLLESHKTSIASINETLGVVNNKVTVLEEETIPSLDEKIESNKSNINSLIEQLKNKVENSTVEQLSSRVESVETAIEDLKEQLDDLKVPGGGFVEEISIEQITDFGPLDQQDIQHACNPDNYI